MEFDSFSIMCAWGKTRLAGIMHVTIASPPKLAFTFIVCSSSTYKIGQVPKILFMIVLTNKPECRYTLLADSMGYRPGP